MWHALAGVVAIILGAEYLSHSIIQAREISPGPWASLADAVLTTLVAFPFILWWFTREGRRREKAEQALDTQEQKYRKFFDSATDAILVFDPDSKTTLDINRAAVELYGWEHDELVGRSIVEISGEPEKTARAIDDATRDKLTRIPLRWHKRKDGRLVPVEISASQIVVGDRKIMLAVCRDIGERLRAEEDRRESFEMQGVLNAMLRRSLGRAPLKEKLAEQLREVVSIPWLSIERKGAVFLKEGAVLTLAAHHGFSSDIQQACARVPVGRCLCGRAVETGRVVACDSVGPEHENSYPGMTPHGHYCVPISADGTMLGVLNLYLKEHTSLGEKQQTFVKAVADILAADISLARVQEQYVQSQKMDSVGRLAGGVAHDFNNLLTAIISYAQFIRDATDAGDTRRGDADEILAAADRAATVTRRLLAFSRRQILSPQTVDLNALVADVTGLLTRLIGEDVRLETRLNPGTCLVRVDRGQLDQVVVNLVVNARDAMPKGGTLTLETGVATPPGDAPDSSAGAIRDPMACLCVRDTGVGMTEDVRSRIFEPFFTTKEQGKGTGLGLSMVFGTVKQSGGEITVESEPGCGAAFRIYLPLVRLEEAQVAGDAGARAAPPRGSETVLLVEDDDLVRRTGERVLKAGGYSVLTASGASDALRVLECHGRPVQLLLTDVVMPGMNGRELALEVSRRGLAGRTLFVSGHTEETVARHGILEPGLALMGKPFTAETLLRRVREVIDGPAGRAKA